MSKIRYRQLKKHWKYLLGDDFTLQTGVQPTNLVDTPFIKLTKKGKLTIKKSYAWDGPSGPMRDDETNMRASLVHDAFYQLMRMRKLGQKKWQEPVDTLFHDMCINDGMKPRRARRAYKALQLVGVLSSKPQSGDNVVWRYAPKK